MAARKLLALILVVALFATALCSVFTEEEFVQDEKPQKSVESSPKTDETKPTVAPEKTTLSAASSDRVRNAFDDLFQLHHEMQRGMRDLFHEFDSILDLAPRALRWSPHARFSRFLDEPMWQPWWHRRAQQQPPQLLSTNQQQQVAQQHATGSAAAAENKDAPLSRMQPSRAPAESSSLAERPFASTGGWPRVDISESSDGRVVNVVAELGAGVRREDVRVDVSDGVLTISGTKQSSGTHKDARFIWRERSEGAFSRSFRLASQVDLANSRAAFNDETGELTLTLPLRESPQVRSIPIDAAAPVNPTLAEAE